MISFIVYRMEKVINTDVLIIGSGAAGLRAAIEAKKEGVDVLIASKSPMGFASCSICSGGGFTAPLGSLTREKYFKMTVTAGEYINDQSLVEILVDESTSRLLELEKFGIKIEIDDVSWPGRCFIPGDFPLVGFNLVNRLAKYAKRMGVKTLDNLMITSLLGDEVVYGALGIDAKKRPICLNAKAVVLASGGAGQVYERNDNPVQITGDGYLMAFEFGLPLIDMEFIQYFPTGSIEEGYPKFMLALPLEIVQSGALQNIHGEELAKKYGLDPKQIYSTQRDSWARAMAKEIFRGSGEAGAVLLDMTRLSIDLQELFKNDPFCKSFKRFPISEKPLHVTPVAHTFLGGVKIDKLCQTPVPGLFATGEVTGGIHGANRVGGNALTECIVFGARAGHNAAQYAQSHKINNIDEWDIKVNLIKIKELKHQKPSVAGIPKKIKSMLQILMWNKAGIIKSDKSLIDAKEGLKRIEEENLTKIYGSKPREIWNAIEAKNLCTVSKLVITSALERKESRGSHYRTDYENKDKNWIKHISLRKKKNYIEVTTNPVNITKLFP
jgi:fumarate reductase (CoM/CoB) subunit A